MVITGVLLTLTGEILNHFGKNHDFSVSPARGTEATLSPET